MIGVGTRVLRLGFLELLAAVALVVVIIVALSWREKKCIKTKNRYD